MLTQEEGREAVHLARNTIRNYIVENTTLSSDLKGVFKQYQGVFVTLHRYPEHHLRGCIGIPLPLMPLKEAIIEAATSATRDPRFPPLDKEELTSIVIEVTILSKPKVIPREHPQDYLAEIQVGRDGLIAEQGFSKGLLLPQVPIEQDWNIEEFLSQTCIKAGLMPDAWLDKKTTISKFSGQIFTEITPGGKIKEKHIDGSDH